MARQALTDPVDSDTRASRTDRTKLSISEDGLFGYNTESIIQYLRICHDYVRDNENLDAPGLATRAASRP
jgi:hypothetical protein